MEQLAELTGLDQCLLGCSGSDSIEAAIKTARLATGRHEVLAFHNGYHGLAFGSLAATDYKAASFRRHLSTSLELMSDMLNTVEISLI